MKQFYQYAAWIACAYIFGKYAYWGINPLPYMSLEDIVKSSLWYLAPSALAITVVHIGTTSMSEMSARRKKTRIELEAELRTYELKRKLIEQGKVNADELSESDVAKISEEAKIQIFDETKSKDKTKSKTRATFIEVASTLSVIVTGLEIFYLETGYWILLWAALFSLPMRDQIKFGIRKTFNTSSENIIPITYLILMSAVIGHDSQFSRKIDPVETNYCENPCRIIEVSKTFIISQENEEITVKQLSSDKPLEIKIEANLN